MKGSGIYIMLTERITLQGQPIAQVARETGLSRNTIKRYLREGEQPHKSKGRKHGSKLDSFKDQIDVLIGNGIYNCQVILERIQTLGYLGEISVLKDYVKSRRPPAVKVAPAVQRYETPAGQQAQMDWGIMKYTDLWGEIRKVAVFVIVLGYSRTCYIEFCRRCDIQSLLRCLLHAFEYFGGVPKVVLTDHMKTVIESSDHGTPHWQEKFLHFATELGFVPKVCRVRRPQTKGKVERLVHYVRDNFLPGRHFTDFGDLQTQAENWCNTVNRRKHATTGEKPMTLLQQEGLLPLPDPGVYEPYRWEIRRVDRECFVSFDGAKYGVNWHHVGEELKASRFCNKILLVDHDGTVVQEHEVCHQSRKHIYAKDQYQGLAEQQGIAYEAPMARQIAIDDVEIRPLSVYADFSGVV